MMQCTLTLWLHPYDVTYTIFTFHHLSVDVKLRKMSQKQMHIVTAVLTNRHVTALPCHSILSQT